ncbi:MAG: DUF1207 domain-containing protein [Chlamydiae bacterium]|nr:DUF1207 domain-containing protein [Chlamydiota bacterium]
MKFFKVVFFVFIFTNAFGYEDYIDEKVIAYDEEIAGLNRSDNIPKESLKNPSDEYFEGYLQSLIDMNYYEFKVVVLVKNGTVWLANVPKNKLLAKSIIAYLRDVPGVKEVKEIDGVPPKDLAKMEKYVNRPKVKGVWFPQTSSLYQPMIADPRQVIYSIGYRGMDRVVGRTDVPVSLGDDFPFFRWIDVWPWHGDLQIGVETGIWSVFDLQPHPDHAGGSELVNTDFYVGIPLVYAVNQWAWRFRLYHISSHLGDEYMVNHPSVVRLNPSFESIDVFMSCQATDAWRFYVGPGFILHSDSTFPMDRLYVEYGADIHFWGKKIYYHNLYGTWFGACYFRNYQVNDWSFDGTFMFGYEWSKLQGVGRKIRLFVDYHNGYCNEGQFFKKRTAYWEARMAYGW